MGIHREMYLFVLVNLSGHNFSGTVDVYNHEGCIIYTYIIYIYINIKMGIKSIISGFGFT
jgi:hypothetical protein